MKVTHIKISNILGVAELELSPGAFNEISGPNGAGKTSVLEAIRSVITGGHDATLLRKGEEKGEVVLVLDDGTEIRKRVTDRASPVEVVQGGKKISRPADLIKSLTDTMSANPVDFLRASKKDRVKVLLEAMPIEIDVSRLRGIAGINIAPAPGVHALALIQSVHKQLYDERTGTNRAIKEKQSTINQLQLALPDAPEGVSGSEDELQAKLEEANGAKEAELTRIREKLDGIVKDNQSKIDAIRAETQAKIDEIKAEATAKVDAIVAAERDIEQKANAQREKAIARHTDQVAPIKQALELIRTDRSNAAKREQALATIKAMQNELVDLESDAESVNEALAGVEKYKNDLLSSLPIPGLEVVEGEIIRNGVPFDRLNTAQQVDIAVEIAKLRAGELGLVCVDGAELLDSKAFEEFKNKSLASGLQLFVTRVADGEFGVKSTQ